MWRVWRHLERGSSEGLFLLVILLVLLVATFVVLAFSDGFCIENC